MNMKNNVQKMTNPPIPCGKSPGALIGGLEPLSKEYMELHNPTTPSKTDLWVTVESKKSKL